MFARAPIHYLMKIVTLNHNQGRGRGNFIPLIGFPLITQQRSKLQPWYLAAFSNLLLETFVPNVVSLTHPSFQILGKTQTGVCLIVCHNSRTTHDIDMKLGPVNKLDKSNRQCQKNENNEMLVNCDVIVFFPIQGQFEAIRKPDSGRIFF